MGFTARKLSFAALVAVVSASSPALAQSSKKQCVASYEQAQMLRKERKLTAAEEQLAVCAEDACPAFIRKDCRKWQKDVQAAMPTVLFEVRGSSGKPLKGARVLLDGKVLKDPVDDKAVAVDPGEHVLRYELPGAEAIEQSVKIREGDKDRKLSILFDTGAPEPAGSGAPPPPDKDASSGGVPRVLPFVLGGVGVVGVGAFVVLGVVGRNQRDELRETCAPSCSEDDVSSVRTKLILADVSLGVGIASLGVATYFFLTAPPSKPAAKPADTGSLWVDVKPATGGGFATVGGTF